jgi:hypothetical protein
MEKTNEAQTNPAPETDVMDIQAAMARIRAGCKETDANCDRILASFHELPALQPHPQLHPSDD